MVLQSLRMQALIIIFDGVDKVKSNKQNEKRKLVDLLAEEMVAKRFQFVVTTRPVGIIGAIHRFSGSFDILTLPEVSFLQRFTGLLALDVLKWRYELMVHSHPVPYPSLRSAPRTSRAYVQRQQQPVLEHGGCILFVPKFAKSQSGG